jgi:hypothetical protein
MEAVGSKLDERGRRLFAVCEVRSAGWGGLALVSKITGLARSTINRGEDDLDAEPLAKGRARRAGGGRRRKPIRGSCPRSNAWSIRRRLAIPCGL